MRLFALLPLLFASCIVPELSPEGRPCPCPDGYSCHPTSQTCVEGEIANVGGAANTGGGGAGGDAIEVPPGMVDAGSFYVDATEVTRAQYAEFMAAGFDPATLGATCDWNTTYAPLEEVGSYCEDIPYDFSKANVPITCVDWCDAALYCAWAGKRLCGRVGGGSAAIDELNDPAKSEWYAACSANGTRKYPYVDGLQAQPDDEACNTSNSGGTPIGVGERVGCNGGYEGIFDMVGNVEEWENACDFNDSPKDAGCEMRGYAFYDSPIDAVCTRADRRPHRDFAANSLGFRCCRDL
ncbi:MAG: SUMF1/EgtB/PvdO family nonheme iron enzyme [Polyangiaceae bacterium]|nr:SUMF1/EgtB/PvdO family nonheme iron enzyme [Polyangiaceae bacterium]